MSSLISRLRKRLSFLSDDLLWRSDPVKFDGAAPFTIGITTFIERYNSCLQPLLEKLLLLFPDTPIIVIANGHYEEGRQKEYIKDIESLTSKQVNVKLIPLLRPKSLSSMWNWLIRESETSAILILNDDLSVNRKFPYFIVESGILAESVSTINNSWSHFLITKRIVEEIGPFDEGLEELGGEDDDYLARLAIIGECPADYTTDTIRKKKTGSLKGRINSFGKVISEQKGGYSTINSAYLESKWETSAEPFEGAVEVKGRAVRYWKLH